MYMYIHVVSSAAVSDCYVSKPIKPHRPYKIRKHIALTFVSRAAIGLPFALRAVELIDTLMGLRMQFERGFGSEPFTTCTALEFLPFLGLRNRVLTGHMLF